MNFEEAVKSYYVEYSNFQDRTSRSGYWWAYLWQTMVMAFLYLLGFLIFTVASDAPGFVQGVLGLAWVVVLFGHFIPALSITARRLHDSGLSGWTCLVAIVPFVGSLILLVMLLRPSSIDRNKWGPMPGESDW